MSHGILKTKIKRPHCKRCAKKHDGPKIYLTFKDDFGWVCERCGYMKRVEEKNGMVRGYETD